MPVQTPVEQAASQANAAVLTSTEGMGCFSLPGAVRRFARAQIGLVSQAELVLRLGRVMEIRFLEAMGVISSRLSIARTLASPGVMEILFLEAMGVISSGLSIARTLTSPGIVVNPTIVDARNTFERAITQTPPLGLTMEVGMQVRTPKVATLWRGVRNTSTRTLLRRRILQTARMGPMRKCGNALGERARKC
jgi:hypothetical protein